MDMETAVGCANDDSSESWSSHHPPVKLVSKIESRKNIVEMECELQDATAKSIASHLIREKIRELHLDSQEYEFRERSVKEARHRRIRSEPHHNTCVPLIDYRQQIPDAFKKSSYSDDNCSTQMQYLNASLPLNWKINRSELAANEKVHAPSAKLAKMEKILSDGRHVISKEGLKKVREIVERQVEQERLITFQDANTQTMSSLGLKSPQQSNAQEKLPPKRKVAVVSAFSNYRGFSKCGMVNRHAVWMYPSTKSNTDNLESKQIRTKMEDIALSIKRTLPTRKVAKVVANTDFVSPAFWRMEKEAVSKIIKSMFPSNRRTDADAFNESKQDTSLIQFDTSTDDNSKSSSNDDSFHDAIRVQENCRIVPLTRKNLMIHRGTYDDSKPKKIERIRHYDRDAIQEYILKQKAERKKKQLEEKRKQEALKQRAEFVKKYMQAVRLANSSVGTAKSLSKALYEKQPLQIQSTLNIKHTVSISAPEDNVPTKEFDMKTAEDKRELSHVKCSSLAQAEIISIADVEEVVESTDNIQHPEPLQHESKTTDGSRHMFQVPYKLDSHKPEEVDKIGIDAGDCGDVQISQVKTLEGENSNNDTRWLQSLKRKLEDNCYLYAKEESQTISMDITVDDSIKLTSQCNLEAKEDKKVMNISNSSSSKISTDNSKDKHVNQSNSFHCVLPKKLVNEMFDSSETLPGVSLIPDISSIDLSVTLTDSLLHQVGLTNEAPSEEILDKASAYIEKFEISKTDFSTLPIAGTVEKSFSVPVKDTEDGSTVNVAQSNSVIKTIEKPTTDSNGATGNNVSGCIEKSDLIDAAKSSVQHLNGLVSPDLHVEIKDNSVVELLQDEKMEETEDQNLQDEKMEESESVKSLDESSTVTTKEEINNSLQHESENFEIVYPNLLVASFFAKGEDTDISKEEEISASETLMKSFDDEDDDESIHNQVVKAVSSLFETSSQIDEGLEVPNLDVVSKSILAVDLEEDTMYEMLPISSHRSFWPPSGVSHRINSIRAATKDKPLYSKENQKLRPQDMMILTTITDDTEMGTDMESMPASVSSPPVLPLTSKKEDPNAIPMKEQIVRLTTSSSQKESSNILGLLGCYDGSKLLTFLTMVANMLYESYEQGVPFSQVIPSEGIFTNHTVLKEASAEKQRYHIQFVFDLCKDVCSDLFGVKQLKSTFPWKKSQFVVKPLVPQNLNQLYSPMKLKVISYLSPPQSLPPPNLLELESLTDILKKKKGDKLDRILYEELKEEEPEWRNFDQEEETVKQALVSSMLDYLLDDTVATLKRMYLKAQDTT